VSLFSLGLMIASGAVPAVFVYRHTLERYRARRQLNETPPLEATTPEGTSARVTGTVRALDEKLVAPLCGRECVVFRARVQTHGSGPTTREETFAIVTFAVDRDDGERVVIDADAAVLAIKPATEPRRTLAIHMRRRHFALMHGIALDESTRFSEVLVEPGSRVSITGLVMKEPATAPEIGGERGFRDAPAPMLRLAGNTAHPLVIGKPLD
jgi:hypothetical protein